jgi:transposase
MYYAGIDAHSEYLRVVVLDKDAVVVAEGSVPVRDRTRIAQYLLPYRPLKVVVETCPFWPWLRDELRGEGVKFTLAHAKQLRAIASNAQKNDAVDAHLLARMLVTDLIPIAHAHETSALEQIRLVRHHAWLTRYRTMFANRIHGQLHQSGFTLERESLLRPRGRERLKTLASRMSTEQKRLVRTHLIMIRSVDHQLRILRRCIYREASNDASATLLRSVPGIGLYWSVLLSAELQPIDRFASANHLVSYAGLAPITRASAGHVRYGPLPQAANRWVRGAFVAAAMSHIRHAPASRLTQHYLRTKTRIGWKKARVATARKLARVCYFMLREQRAWHD